MAQHQQIGGAPPNIPLVPSTSTSPHSSPPAPLNTPTFSTSISPPSSSRRQGEHFATQHAIIISLITAVGGYVLFQFQYMKISLFDEHGNLMRASLVMLFFYVLAFMAEFRLQNNESNYFAIMKEFTPLFGLVVVVLLLFILSFFLGLAASIIWAFLVVGPTLKLFQEIIQLRGIIQDITTDQTATSNPDIQYTNTDQTTSNPDIQSFTTDQTATSNPDIQYTNTDQTTSNSDIQSFTTEQTTSNPDIQSVTIDQTATSNPDVEERDPLDIL